MSEIGEKTEVLDNRMTCPNCRAGRLPGHPSCHQCHEVYPGAEIEGHLIETIIGRGGMGVIYSAVHPVLQRKVAVKILKVQAPSTKARQELTSRFLREARSLARVNHPGIVQVYSAGTTSEVPYIIMELISGRSLAAVLTKTPILPIGQTIDVLLQLTRAMDYAWTEKQLVHRDVKPDNVMLLDDNCTVKLLDLGIAKTREDILSSSLTRSGIGLGTPTYMAPEQMTDARSVDFRADVYALGVLATQMMTGRKPFTSTNEASLYVEKMKGVPEHVVCLSPTAPGSLKSLLLRMMAPDPDNRPDTYAEIAQALQEAKKLFDSSDQIAGTETEVMPVARQSPPPAANTPPPSAPPVDPTVEGTRPWIPGISDNMPLIDHMHSLLNRVCSRGHIGDYEMGNLIGYGGMGAVFRARHLPTGRDAALKFLLAGDEEDLAKRLTQFQNEAKLVQRLSHPSIVEIRGIHEAQSLHFIEMELFLGFQNRPINLSDYAAEFGDREGRLESAEMKNIALVLLDALGYAHEQRVVHCDLKPENILFQYVGDAGNGFWNAHLKLTDFGVAKVIGEKFVLESVNKSVTAFGAAGEMPDDARALIGTYDYMSPEQRRGKPATERSDLFAVGLMLLRLLTGRKQLGLRGKPSTLRSGLNAGWDEIILTAVRERPDSRYPSAAAMADAIQTFVSE